MPFCLHNFFYKKTNIISKNNIAYYLALYFLLFSCSVYKSSGRQDFENEYSNLQQSNSNLIQEQFRLLQCQSQSYINNLIENLNNPEMTDDTYSLNNKIWVAEIYKNENLYKYIINEQLIYESEKIEIENQSIQKQFCLYEKIK